MELEIPKFALSEENADYCVTLASRVCSGVTKAHYYEYINWAYKSNDGKWSSANFVKRLCRRTSESTPRRMFAWHMEIKNGKKVRVDDHFELIPAPPLKR